MQFGIVGVATGYAISSTVVEPVYGLLTARALGVSLLDFVRNLAGARHVNIAHGLYPRDPLPPAALDGLAAYLRRSVTAGQGRTYAGGLTKFEPGEMERLPVPVPALLPAYAPAAAGRGSAGGKVYTNGRDGSL